jgi:hypothetical protein
MAQSEGKIRMTERSYRIGESDIPLYTRFTREDKRMKIFDFDRFYEAREHPS